MAHKNKSNEIPVGSPSGLPLFYIAVVESAKMAGMTERDAIRLMVRSWFGDEVANLLDARIRRTGEGGRAPKALLDIMSNGYYWNKEKGRVERDATWKKPEDEPAEEVE